VSQTEHVRPRQRDLLVRLLQAARRYRALVLLGAGVIVALALWGLRGSRVDPDVLNLLPQTGPAVRAFRTYLERFGSLDRVYIVFEAPSGHTIEEYSEEIERYAATVRRLPEIRSVDTTSLSADKDWGYVFDRLFFLVGPEDARRGLERLSSGALRESLDTARGRLAIPGMAARSIVQEDPLNLLDLVYARLAPVRAVFGVDLTSDGYVSRDGMARLVIAWPAQPPFDASYSRGLVDHLNAVERTLMRPAGNADDLPRLRVRYGGGYHISLEAQRTVRREAMWNLGTSLAAILGLLIVVFRSPWLFFVGALPMLGAGILVLSLDHAVFGPVSAAAAGASALLFGLGIDGLVLLYVRYVEVRPRTQHAAAALALMGPTTVSMLLGMGTTSASFLALMLVDFPALQELGRLIGAGMLLGAVLTCVLVAALLPANVGSRRSPTLPRLSGFVTRRRALIVSFAVVLTIACGLAARELRLDLTLQRLQPRTAATAFERELRERFGLPDNLLIVMASGQLDPLLEQDARLVGLLHEADPTLAVSSASMFLPPPSEQARVRSVLERTQLSAAEVEAELRRAAGLAGFRPGAFAPFLARLPHLLDAFSQLTYDGYRSHGFGGLLAPYIVQTAGGFATAAYINPRSPADVDVVRRTLGAAAGSGQLTGLTIVNDEITKAFVPKFLSAVALGSLVVFGLLLVTFRSLVWAAWALLPALLGLIWSLGILAVLRVELDLFSMFGMLTFIGIGVDYGIHLVHRCRTGDTLAASLAAIAPVNVIAAGIAVFGCGTLVWSEYPPLHGLGVISVVTLITCLAASIFVLPACLTRRPP